MEPPLSDHTKSHAYLAVQAAYKVIVRCEGGAYHYGDPLPTLDTDIPQKHWCRDCQKLFASIKSYLKKA